ncbi:MAG: hypothetical protein ACXWPM_05145 [Bdellovibrionota bacterium]
MKPSVLMVMSALLMTSSVYAGGNEGPAGSPMHPDPVIAQVRDNGPVIPTRISKTLVIRASGAAVYFDDQAPQPDLGTPVAKLSAQTLEKLQAMIAQIPAGELADLDEGKPRCYGSGGIEYSVLRQGTMELTNFATDAMCHRYRYAGDPGESVIELLSALLRVARLQPSDDTLPTDLTDAPIAQKVVSDGFVPPSMPHAYGVKLRRNGLAVRFTVPLKGAAVETPVLEFSESSAAKIAAMLDSIPTDYQPQQNDSHQPRCEDGPSITSLVYTLSGAQVEISQVVSCVSTKPATDYRVQFAQQVLDLLYSL